MEESVLTAALERSLREHFGRAVIVADLTLLAGGASRNIYGFSAHVDGEAEPRALVARSDAAPGRIRGTGVDEFALVAAAAEAGARVPRVYCRGRFGGSEGTEFYVMDRLGGEAIARKLHREDRYARARERLPEDLAKSLARIHSIDPGDPRLESLRRERASQENDGGDFAACEISRYRELLTLAGGGHPFPVLALAGRWLEKSRPECARQAVVHGDFRVGNVMFDEEGLTGVLDWELARIGDPLEDLGWLAVRAWRFGRDDLAIGGLCSRERFWELYERESGSRVDSAAARYWEIFGNWKWSIICVMQGASHKAGPWPDVELAAIGRRVAEVEWEILDLLEEADRAG
jgi:aminoglycoside phosphotransferase (APT) family kinase protein